MSWGTNPLYALLHESIYCQGAASSWAAQRVREQHYQDAFDATAAANSGEHTWGQEGGLEVFFQPASRKTDACQQHVLSTLPVSSRRSSLRGPYPALSEPLSTPALLS